MYKGLYIYDDARARVEGKGINTSPTTDRRDGKGTVGNQKSTPALNNLASEDCHVIFDHGNHDKVLVACATCVI
jgi:hypothetical protein